ncbi:endonuclease domain-containing protein [Brevundimonas sp.]|uniref:endonuclease domain-containing protein n=1 Tax=Brevundimonas sp. TaxID=1871086 RepID=UPI00248A73D4|nr:endonuclease domain-containing protein [Brevundimonas sp.]MDI1282329.1 endonuclease domain-containing protein [Brevundimonas sp.]
MTRDADNNAPLPLEGEGGGGWGEGTPRPESAPETPASSSPPPEYRASTPTQPSPLEGEGFDRFARTPRIKAGGVNRARRLRKAPTFTEARLWKRLRTFAVRFRRQAPIGPFVVDFACHRAKLVIEVDGGVHTLPEVALRDVERDAWLTGQGYTVLRFTSRQVEDDIETVLDQVRRASPLPLEGEGGGGWGEAAGPAGRSPETPASCCLTAQYRAFTPSQPFPLEGKGSSDA